MELSLSKLSSVELDKLPVRKHNTVKICGLFSSPRSPLLSFVFAFCAWQHRQQGRGNKRRKATKSGPRRFKVTVQLATIGNIPNGFRHTHPPPSLKYTHIKIKTREKRKTENSFFFFLKGNDSDQFFRSLTPLPVISILLLELLHSVDKRLPARERQHTHNTYTREEKNEEKKNKTKRKSSASDHDDDDAQLTRPTHRRPNLSTTGTVRCGGRE